MKSVRKLIYLVLPLQILVLLLSPRFGWNIHNSDATVLKYEGMSYEDGAFHICYENDSDTIDISYGNLFSKKFTITVNDADVYWMEVKVDGESVESEQDMLPWIGNDLVWQDTYGIFYWRCILAIVLSLISIKGFQRGGRAEDKAGRIAWCACAVVTYIFAILISLRVIL